MWIGFFQGGKKIIGIFTKTSNIVVEDVEQIVAIIKLFIEFLNCEIVAMD